MDRVPVAVAALPAGLFFGVYRCQQLQNDDAVGQSLHFGWAWRDCEHHPRRDGLVSQVIPVFVIVGASFAPSAAPC